MRAVLSPPLKNPVPVLQDPAFMGMVAMEFHVTVQPLKPRNFVAPASLTTGGVVYDGPCRGDGRSFPGLGGEIAICIHSEIRSGRDSCKPEEAVAGKCPAHQAAPYAAAEVQHGAGGERRLGAVKRCDSSHQERGHDGLARVNLMCAVFSEPVHTDTS